MKIIKDLFSSRLFTIILIVSIFFCFGVYLYVGWDLDRYKAQLISDTEPILKNRTIVGTSTEETPVRIWKTPEKRKPFTDQLMKPADRDAAVEDTYVEKPTVSQTRSSATEGVLHKTGKFNIFENYMSEFPLPNQAELEDYWTLEKMTEEVLNTWREEGFPGTEFAELTEADIINRTREGYQQHVNMYGIPPPPPDHYVVKPDHANGRAYYARKNEVYVDLVWDRYGTNIDWLNNEDWNIYIALGMIRADDKFTMEPLSESYVAVAQKWRKELEESTRGPLARIVSHPGVFTGTVTPESINSLTDQKRTQIQISFNQFFKKPSRPANQDFIVDVRLINLLIQEIDDELKNGDF